MASVLRLCQDLPVCRLDEMASGSRLFADSATLRNIPYPGSFSTEFMFRGPTNPFSHVQFVPERIVQFSISPEGIRFYKVQWQETWLPEHHLLQYQTLVDIFWRNQNEQVTTCGNNEQTPISASTSGVAKCIKGHTTESFLTALQTDSVLLDPPIPQVPAVIEKPLEKQIVHNTVLNSLNSQVFDANVIQHSKEQVFNGNVIQHTKRPAIQEIASHQEKEILEKNIIPSTLENTAHEHNIECSDDTLNLPNSQIMMDDPDDDSGYQATQSPSDDENHVKYKTNENELTKVISQVKKNKSMSLQLEGFELTNIENTSATEEELKIQAQEVLCSFSKKRVRCPNGSSQLPHSCFFCTKILSSRKKLREHQFSIHFKNVGEFACDICQQRFAFRRKLKAHMITHSDNRNFICKICGLTCKRRTHLHTHMETHEKERNYRCDVCHKNFKVQADLKEHCLNEHKNQISKCNVCKHTLQTAFSVYIHSMRHSGTREHTCQVCKASFKSKHHLTAHEKTHTNPTENIQCPACDDEFPDKKYFRKHLELSHKELVPNYRYDYICTICDKDFAYKGRLDEHMRTHEEETEEERMRRVKHARKKKVESMSDEALSELRDKIEKITNPETGEIKLSCKLCRRREFRLISTMEKHLEDHKAGLEFKKVVGDFECVTCKKSFPSEARLLRHSVVHQVSAKPVKPNSFQCRSCKSIFKWKSCLQTHMKKCAPISKGAGKRKATLKAKEKLRRQIEDASSEEEMRIVQLDGKSKAKKGSRDTFNSDSRGSSEEREIEKKTVHDDTTASADIQHCNSSTSPSSSIIADTCPEDIIKLKKENTFQEVANRNT